MLRLVISKGHNRILVCPIQLRMETDLDSEKPCLVYRTPDNEQSSKPLKILST
jgi:hypothetical protein